MGRSGSESSRSRSSRDKSAGRKKPKHETKKDKKDKKHKHDEGGQASLPGASASSCRLISSDRKSVGHGRLS